MKYRFITQNPENHELVVFFHGWGMDENIPGHWPIPGFDLVIIYDYKDFSSTDELKQILSDYKSVVVLAWSMGVWAYTRIATELALPVERAIAINGSPNPIHDEWGIPAALYQATLDGFSGENRDRFFRRMCSTRDIYTMLQEHLPLRKLEDQRTELQCIKELALSEPEHWHQPFHACVISQKDLIIPTDNQKNFWNGRAEIIEIPGGHYPFHLWDSWEDMLEFIFQS